MFWMLYDVGLGLFFFWGVLMKYILGFGQKNVSKKVLNTPSFQGNIEKGNFSLFISGNVWGDYPYLRINETPDSSGNIEQTFVLLGGIFSHDNERRLIFKKTISTKNKKPFNNKHAVQ